MTTDPMPCITRLATRGDVAEICRISNWAAANTAANFAIEPEPIEQWHDEWDATATMFPWMVAESGGGIVGFAKAAPHRGRCAYHWTAEVTVYIDPDHHGRGVGRSLYAALVPILRSQGYRTLLAGITLPNPASVRLHESFGFQRVGIFERVGWKFEQFHDVSYWQATLDSSTSPPPPLRPVSEVYHSPAAAERAEST